jgi:hypothetical protein
MTTANVCFACTDPTCGYDCVQTGAMSAAIDQHRTVCDHCDEYVLTVQGDEHQGEWWCANCIEAAERDDSIDCDDDDLGETDDGYALESAGRGEWS